LSLLLLLLGLSAGACGEPEEGGPRGVAYKNAEDDDGGVSQAQSCADLECEEPAQCFESVEDGVPSARCECPTGYSVVDLVRCVDFDECARAEDNECRENSVCQNLEGSFACPCKQGFLEDGDSCKILDACEGVANVCHPDAVCTLDDEREPACECVEGRTGDGFACADIDECVEGTDDCVEDATCTNTRDGFECACGTLFSGDGKVQCRDRCELAQADAERCDPDGNGRCTIDSTGAAACSGCAPGFLGDGATCTANAECAALDCGANTDCAGAAGDRSCECAPGFDGDPSAGCEDIDECEGGQADCDASTSQCLNVPGGFLCDCLPGFERQGEVCVNVNECERDLDLCDPNADCTDQTPKYDCACKAGYSGDGFACRDVDECQSGEAECNSADSAVTCVNTRGSFECKCPAGYAGNGVDEACYCDVTGYWAMRQDALLVFPQQEVAGNIILAPSMTRATIWELHKLRYDGTKIVVERKQCGSDVYPELHSPLYGETYSSFTPNEVYDLMPLVPGTDIPLAKSDALPGESFDTPLNATLNGIKLDDPVNDPWPAKFQDVPDEDWVDSDEDGQPGIPLWPGQTSKTPRMQSKPNETYEYLPVGLIEGGTDINRRMGCVSVALRGMGRFQVEIDTCTRLTGLLLEGRTEGRVHSCTQLRESDWDSLDVTCSADDWATAPRLCGDEEVEFLDTQDQTNSSSATFEMVKLAPVDAEGLDCDDVRMKLPAIERD
jgi:Calcium-binding EGF domain/EGF domain